MPNTSDSVELAVLEHLQKGQLLLQKSQREAGIQAEVNKFKGAGTKRAVKFTKELLFQCEDLADIFKVEEGEEFAQFSATQQLFWCVINYTGEQNNIFFMGTEISQLILAGFWSHMPK